MKLVIVGNNVAGITTAKMIRDLRPDVDISVFSEERYNYYSRPMLIEFIAGKIDEKKIFFYPEDWYHKNRIKIHLSTSVEKIDRDQKKVFDGDKWYDFDVLVLATGATPFMPPIKGLPKENIFTLRTLDDAKRIIERIPKSKSAVILGGGLLGLESARALTLARPNLSVIILEMGEYILPRHLDREGAGVLRALMEEMGIDVITEAQTDEFLGDGKVEGIRLKDGQEIDAELVIVSAGVRSNVLLAKEANLPVNKGVIVDNSLQCDAQNKIFAVGDVAEYGGIVWGIIPAALEQAKILAKKILGIESPYYEGTVPSNTLKVLGCDLTSIGIINPPNEEDYEVIKAKSDDGRVYKKYVLKDGILVGTIILGSRKEIGSLTKMINEGRDVSGFKGKMRQSDFEFTGL